MLPTPEQTRQELDTPASNDAIQQLDATYAYLRSSVRDVMEAEEDGLINQDTADEAIRDLVATQVELQTEILDFPLEELGDDLEAIQATGYPAQSFGEALTALIAAESGDFDDAIAQISANTGIDPEIIADYCNGDDVPTGEDAEAIGLCFRCCHEDPDALDHLIDLAQLEGSEMEDIADMGRQSAQLSAEFAALRNERTQMSERADLQHRIKAAEKMADEMLAASYISPAERRELLPIDLAPDDRADFTAFFSMSAEAMGVSPSSYMDCIEFTMQFLAKRGKVQPTLLTDFSLYQEPEPANREEEDYLASYRSKHSYC